MPNINLPLFPIRKSLLLITFIVCIVTGLAMPTTQVHAAGPTNYVWCANENRTCSFSGTANVAYGSNGTFYYRTVTGSIACNNATWGDPIPGISKSCYYGPGGFTFCANENGTCSFSGTANVTYGANSMFNYTMAMGSIGCNNSAFGDPIYGAAKACYYRYGPSGYTFCANEGGTCSFSGTASIGYGANGSFNYLSATSSIGCNNATFGDPISGTPKACYYQSGGGSFVVSEAQFNSWFPNRNGLYQYNNFISAHTSYSGFALGFTNNDKIEAAAFFAHIAHETSSLVYVNEIAGGVYCGGNAAYGCAAGQNYYGRGPLQLTWNYNYKMAATGNYYANGCCWEARMTPGVGADIWSNPNLVATDGVITWKTALWYWMTHGKDWDPAQPTVHDDIINIGFGETTRDINGGLECGQSVGSTGYNQMMDRANIYGNFLANLGGSDGRSRTC